MCYIDIFYINAKCYKLFVTHNSTTLYHYLTNNLTITQRRVYLLISACCYYALHLSIHQSIYFKYMIKGRKTVGWL